LFDKNIKARILAITGVARNFDWFWLGGGGQNGKILWRYFDDVIWLT